MTEEAYVDERAKPRPTLLVLTSTYPRWQGDPEPGFVHELSKRLSDKFDVTVLGPHAPGARRFERMDGVEVVRYRYAPERFETLVNDGGIVTNLSWAKWKLLLVPGFVLAQIWQAWRLVRSREIDVIHAHWLIPQGLVAALLGKPFVVTSHGADLFALKGRALDALKRFVIRRSAGATVVSTAMRDELRRIGTDTGKVTVQPMGVDLAERFSPDGSVARSNDEILFVGRLVEKKGVRYLLDAMPAILRECPSARLTIAGFGPDEPKLRHQVEALGLSTAVMFIGAVPQVELPALYRRAAVLVAPFVQADSGDQEGLGLVLVEAIGCGCPVVAGNVSAVSDVFGDDTSVLAVDSRDSSALAAKVVETLSNQVDALTTARRIRGGLVDRFGWSGVAQRYANQVRSCARDIQEQP